MTQRPTPAPAQRPAPTQPTPAQQATTVLGRPDPWEQPAGQEAPELASKYADYIDASEIDGAVRAGGDITPIDDVLNFPLLIRNVVDHGVSQKTGRPVFVIEAERDQGNGTVDTVSFFAPGNRLGPLLLAALNGAPGKAVAGIITKDPLINDEPHRGYQLVSYHAQIQLDRTGRTLVTLPA